MHRSFKFPVLLLLGMVSLIVVLGMVSSKLPPPPYASATTSSDPGGQYDAQVACKRLVTDALRSPSSAKFSDDPTSSHIGVNTWRINGWVDAQNGFGAQIRNNYECEVRYAGGSWQREALTVLPR